MASLKPLGNSNYVFMVSFYRAWVKEKILVGKE
jgi:hypothetical protein